MSSVAPSKQASSVALVHRNSPQHWPHCLSPFTGMWHIGWWGWPMGARAKLIEIVSTCKPSDSLMLQFRNFPTWVRYIWFGVERWLVDP
eukprot:COSAG02_NODE_2581_length_8490_cov_31.587534_8_plen_89_part_00